MPKTIRTAKPDKGEYLTKETGLVDGRQALGSRGGHYNTVTEHYIPSPEAVERLKARLQVKVPRLVREVLDPLYKEYKGSETIMRYAERLEIVGEDGAFAWLSREPKGIVGNSPTLWFSPTPKLIERARGFYLSPHILVRAAADKVAYMLDNGLPLD